MSKRQRELALGAVAILVFALAAMRINSARSVSPTGAASQAASGAGQASAAPTRSVVDIQLDALKATRPEPMQGVRNPFGFKPKAPPPAPAAVAKVAPVIPTGPPVPPPPPPIALKFIGVLSSPTVGRLAVLSDPRGVYQGREGETIEGRYRILKIGVESVELAYLDGRGRQTIRLSGQ